MAFKVWIIIEEHRGDDDYQELDLRFASTATFRKHQDAVDFSERLHLIGEQLSQATKEGKR